MVEYICCFPRPISAESLGLNDTTIKYRQVLKTIVYGELGAVCGRGYLFGLFDGLVQLCAMYVDYSAYATMRSCHTLLVGFLGAWEVLFYILDYTNARHSEKIKDSMLNQCLFYIMVAFAATKFLCAMKIYKELKLHE